MTLREIKQCYPTDTLTMILLWLLIKRISKIDPYNWAVKN